MRSGPSRSSRRNVVLFWVESVCSFLRVFKPRSFQVLHRHISACCNLVSRSSSILRVRSGTKRIRCCVFPCQHHFKRLPMCFCVVCCCCFDVFLAGLVTVACQGGQKSDCLYTYVFFSLFMTGVVLAQILVTILVSERYSMLRV